MEFHDWKTPLVCLYHNFVFCFILMIFFALFFFLGASSDVFAACLRLFSTGDEAMTWDGTGKRTHIPFYEWLALVFVNSISFAM